MRRATPKTPEWIFHGGRVLDARRAARSAKQPRGAGLPAEAVLTRGGLIEAVGPLRTLERAAGRRVERVDLEGGTLTPGFVDSHIHLITWNRALGETWLRAQTVEALERAALAADPAGEEGWVAIRGWVPREWPRELKRRETLDRVAPDRPLVLFAVDGHSVWANGQALARAGIGAKTPDPPGGLIDRDSSGEPTGILVEEAAPLVRRLVPPRRDPAEELPLALRRARALGITSAHDFDRSGVRRAAQLLDAEGKLGFRLLLSIPLSELDSARSLELQSGWGSGTLLLGPVKLFADGTLGSATAHLESPYEGGASTGVEVTTRVELAERIERAAAAGLSVAVHAIGDRAVRNTLDAVEEVKSRGRAFPLPPRIEHIQLAREEDFPRFRALGVIASVQPIHQVSDRELARRQWGGRTARSYAWRSLHRAGASVIFGSDAPFDRAGPLLAIQAALLRRRGQEPEGAAFHPEQRLTLAQALHAHLEEPHRAAGWGVRLGRIEAGFGADLVVFDQDLLTAPPDSFHEIRARGVWVGGERVHGK